MSPTHNVGVGFGALGDHPVDNLWKGLLRLNCDSFDLMPSADIGLETRPFDRIRLKLFILRRRHKVERSGSVLISLP